MIMKSFCEGVAHHTQRYSEVTPICLPAEETMGVEAGAGGREDVQEGMNGGG